MCGNMNFLNNSVSKMNSTNITTCNLTYDEYCDYDYDSTAMVPVEEVVPVAIVYGFTMIFGVIGNTLVIVSVARFKKMQNVTNMFLLSLASADLLLVLICVPVKCIAFFSYVWRFGEVLCKTVHYLQNVSILCSVMNLTVLSLERYYAIMHPIRAKCVSTVALAKKTALVIWLLSLVMATPILIGRIHKPVGKGDSSGYWCILQWNNDVVGRIYGVYMFLVVLFIPLVLMSVAYSCICIRVWMISSDLPQTNLQIYRPKDDQRNLNCTPDASIGIRQELIAQRNRSTNNLGRKTHLSTSDHKTRQQVIKMLVAVVLIFMICWGPIMTNNLLVAFRVLNDLNEGPMRPMRIAFFLMSYFNSCTNPLVYAFMSRHFRNTFKQTLFILCKKYTNVHHHHLTAKYSCDTRSVSFHTGKSLHVINDATDKDKVLNGYNVSRGNSHWTNARKKRPSKNEIELHNIKLKNTLMTDSRV